MLAYYLAVNHPNNFSAVFVCSAKLDSNFFPDEVGGTIPPIHAYHGKNDNIIPLSGAKKTVREIEAFSDSVYLQEYDNGHGMTRAAVDDMENKIIEYIGRKY